MSDVNTAQIGRFCWFELGTTDQNAAKKFYSTLFGWTWNDNPMGPTEVYSIFQLRGRDVAACYTMRPDQLKQGVPPHWMTYIAVTSADEAGAKAASLGAKVIMPAFDVFDVGRMAIIQDPTGAMFCVWQGKKNLGVGVFNEPNAFCWSELQTRDTAAAEKFYTAMFGWKAKTDSAGPTAYTEWSLPDIKQFGGMMAISEHMGPVPPHWNNYVSVTNCDEFVNKAVSLGGKVYVPPMDIPDTGRFAVLADPQGAVFSIINLQPQHQG